MDSGKIVNRSREAWVQAGSQRSVQSKRCVEGVVELLLHPFVDIDARWSSAQELLKASVDDAKGPPIVASPNS